MSWLGLSFVLLLIIISGRFIKYLQQAAMGDLSPQLLGSLMVYRIPGFLEMVFPLAFFMTILLVYGRMYADSEMIALQSGGFSEQKLLQYTVVVGTLIALVTALFSFWVTPWGMDNVNDIFRKQRNMTAFETLSTGRFQSWGGQTTYVERLTDERQVMNKIFIVQQEQGRSNVTLLLADSGKLQIDGNTRQKYLMLFDGYRYDITPGQKEGRAFSYSTYGIHMQEKAQAKVNKKSQLPFAKLYASKNPEYQAEWQWRISLPMQVLISILIAVPMARVNPRQGRYFKLLPGILLFLVYVAALVGTRVAIKDGNVSPYWGMALVHTVFLMVGIIIYFGRGTMKRLIGVFK